MRRRKAPDTRRAFTLIETILAITIFSFIAVGISASFFSGVTLWGRAANTDSRRNDIMLNFELVSKGLRESVDIPLIGFAGEAKSFSFPSISGDSIIRASYSFDAERKMLSRRETKFEDIINESGKDNAVGKDILSLDELHFQYLYRDAVNNSLEWRDSWKVEDGKFAAIRFTWKVKDEEFRKTVFIPIAQ